MKRIDPSTAQAEHRWPANPYPGLRPFLITEDSDESLIFFGRKEQVHDLLDRLGDTHFMAVLGPSGCGKSSLVKAGMIPALSSGLIYQAGANWVSAEAEPGSAPIQNLAQAVADALQHAKREDGAADIPDAETLAQRMQASTSALVDLAEELPKLLEDNTNLLILVDQFEEIFREDLAQRDEDAQLINLLLNVFYMRPEGLYVVLTMRTDYLEQCATFHGLPEALNQSQFLTPRLNSQQLSEAISGPAALLQYGGKVEPRLARTILDEMTGSSGYDPDLLPLMQHALFWMWRNAQDAQPKSDEPVLLTLEAYQELAGEGGLQGVLSRRADDIYLNKLTTEQQRIAECMFRLMSEVDDGARRRRRVTTPQEVAENADVSLSEAREVIDQFADDAVTFIRWKDGGTTLDVTHESLIRKWDRLDAWAQEERADAEEYRDLEKATVKWAQDNRATLTEAGLLRWDEFRARKGNVELWAARYGSGFADVAEYVRVSRERVEEAKERHQTQEKLREEIERAAEAARAASQRTRRLSAAIAVVLLLAGGALWGWINVFFEKGVVEQKSEELKAVAKELADKKEEADAAKLVALAETESLRKISIRNADLAKVAFEAITLRRAAIIDKEVDEGRPATALRLGLDTHKFATDKDQQFHLALARAATLAPQPGAELLGRFGTISSARWLDDGRGWVSLWQNGVIHNVNTPGDLSRPFKVGSAQVFVPGGLSPFGSTALVTTKSGGTALIDTLADLQPVSLTNHDAEAAEAQFSEDGASVVTVTYDNQLGVWDTETGDQVSNLVGVVGHVFRLSADGTRLVTASHLRDETDDTAYTMLRLWSMQPNAVFVYYVRVPGTIISLDPNEDASKIAIGLKDGTVKLLGDAGQTEAEFQAHTQVVNAITLSANGKQLATAGAFGELKLWSLEGNQPERLRTATLRGGNLQTVAFSPDGREIMAKSLTQLHLLDTSTLSQKLHVRPDGFPVALSSDGSRVLTRAHAGKSWVWDAATGERLAALTKPTPKVRTLSAAFSYDGTRVAAAYWDGTILISDANTGRLLKRLEKQSGRIVSLAFSPDDTRLLIYSIDGASNKRVASVRSLETGNMLIKQALVGGEASFGFSQTGNWFFAQTAEGSIKVWNAGTGALLNEVTDEDSVFKKAVLFEIRRNTDTLGVRLMTTTGHVTKVWNVDAGKTLYTPTAHQTPVEYLAVNADGSVLMTLSREEVKLWRVRADPTAADLRQIGRTRGENFYVGVFDRDGGPNFTLFSRGNRSANSGGPNARRAAQPASIMSYWTVGSRRSRLRRRSRVAPSRLVRQSEIFGPIKFSAAALSWTSPQHLMALTQIQGRVRTWRLQRGHRAFTLDGSGPVISMRRSPSWADFTPKNSILAHDTRGLSHFRKTQNGSAKWRDVWRGKQVQKVRLRGLVADLSADGKFVVAPSETPSASVVEVETGELVATLSAPDGRVNSAVFDPAGRKILTTHEDATARVWSFDPELKEAKLQKSFVFGRSGTNGLVAGFFDSTGEQFVTAARDGTVALWAVSSQAPLQTLPAPVSKIVYAVGFTPDGMCIFTENGDGKIRLLNRKDLEEPCVNSSATQNVLAPALTGYRILSYAFDGAGTLSAVSGMSDVSAGGVRHAVLAIYHEETGRPVAVWKEKRTRFAGWANWTKDGSKLVVPMASGQIHVLNRPARASWESVIAFAKQAAKPALSQADRKRLELLDVDRVIRLAN